MEYRKKELDNLMRFMEEYTLFFEQLAAQEAGKREALVSNKMPQLERCLSQQQAAAKRFLAGWSKRSRALNSVTKNPWQLHRISSGFWQKSCRKQKNGKATRLTAEKVRMQAAGCLNQKYRQKE